jgi:hypothetical protein
MINHYSHVERIGDIETVTPDPQMTELVRDIVKQHDKILEINARLLQVLSQPLLKIAYVGDDTKDPS